MRFVIANDLVDFSNSSLLFEVGQIHLPNNASPSLLGHYSRLIATTGRSAPACRLGIRTRGVGHHSPLSLPIGWQVLMFHDKACTRVMPPYIPVAICAVIRLPADFIPKIWAPSVS